MNNNILKMANEIVNERSEEKDRQYGPFSEGMERAAKIMSGATGKDITAYDMYWALVALKMSRQSYNHKTDNLLDAVAYIGALNNHIEKDLGKKVPLTEEQEDEIISEIKYPCESRAKGWKGMAILRDIQKNSFTTAKRQGVSNTTFMARVEMLKKKYKMDIFSTKNPKFPGRYTISGSNRGFLDLIVSEWDQLNC